MKSKISHQINVAHPKSVQNSAGLFTLWLGSVGSVVTHLGPMSRGLITLMLLLLAAISMLAPMFPRRVIPASAPLDLFSGERALVHLPIIAKEPHPAGSPAQARVRDYLVQQLSELGVDVQVQQVSGVENVVARLYGTAPSGAILLQTHYDSFGGPGAADNGAGVAALLEIMRCLSDGPALRHDVIALFDDSEELPDPFTGTKAFVRTHPWMEDVRVAIGMDTAVRGFISINDTGSDNGWLVRVLARSYTGGAWSSLGGSGNYDSQPFRDAGIRVLELEDNYPFYQQHTRDDTPEIINPGTLQQLGEQALAVTRELGSLDLSNTSGRQETYFYIPLLGLVHYPEEWSLPLAVLAGLLLVIAFVLTLRRKLASWWGLALAALVIIAVSVLAGLGTHALWKAAPGLLNWETSRWTEWPEVIPPYGWQLLILGNLLVLLMMAAIYRLGRRWSARTDFSLVGLSILLLFAIALAILAPRGAILPTWPVLLGSVFWIMAAMMRKDQTEWPVDLGSLLAAIPVVMFLLLLVPAVFMGDGTLSVAMTAGLWVILLGVILPAIDGLLAWRTGSS